MNPGSGDLFYFVVSQFADEDLQVVIRTSEQAKLFTLLALYIAQCNILYYK